MSYTETTSVSWFGRIRRSFGGVLVGLLLIVGMIVLLFWNEGRAVQTARSLAEGAGLVVTVDAGSIDASRDGMLIHVVGPVETQERLRDPEFGIVSTGVRLDRKAEMYQWIETSKSETRKKVGGGEETVTTYSYDMGWSDRPQDSSQFKQPGGHSNPPMEVRGERYVVSSANLGAFDLSQRVLGMIGGAQKVQLSPDQTDAIQHAVGAGMKVNVTNGLIYLGSNPQEPRLGDYRVSYELVPLGTISVVGRQSGSGFDPYQTQAGDALLMVENGSVAAQQMFEDAMASNTVITWIVRIVGLIFLIVGFSLVMGPLGVIGDVIPFIGSIVRMGTGIIATFAGIIVGTVVIAFAWFWYRPITALIILIVGAALAYGVTLLGKRRQAAAPGGEPPVQPASGA